MKSYLDLLRHVMAVGEDRTDRTGVGTRSVFGYQWSHNLQDGLPMLTTKKMFARGVIEELRWFIAGDNNVSTLQEKGVHIWDAWARPDGTIGRGYGTQWRSWRGVPPTWADGNDADMRPVYTDQLGDLVTSLRRTPDSRRHIVSAWNVADVPGMALPPCHTLFQCYVHTSRRLDLHLYCRSIDSFLGLPFNILSYAFLVHMLAQVTGLVPGRLILSFGDLHIYQNHFEQVQLQCSREPMPLPKLTLDTAVTEIDKFSFESFKIDGYQSHPAIKAPIAV